MDSSFIMTVSQHLFKGRLGVGGGIGVQGSSLLFNAFDILSYRAMLILKLLKTALHGCRKTETGFYQISCAVLTAQRHPGSIQCEEQPQNHFNLELVFHGWTQRVSKGHRVFVSTGLVRRGHPSRSQQRRRNWCKLYILVSQERRQSQVTDVIHDTLL